MTAQNVHRFTHAAMGTIFEINICHDDHKYAQSASLEAFRLLDQLEHYLSHFIANSDISRISNLPVGGSTQVGYDTFECLLQCIELYRLSKGVFDVTIGALYHCWLHEDKSLKSPSQEDIAIAKSRVGLYHLTFDETSFRVGKTDSPVQLDLGGFGKGYALDKLAELLAEWDIDSYLLNGGQSSILFGQPPPGQAGWPITISDPFDNYHIIKELLLKNVAIGSSGLSKGRHIIDPRTALPLENTRAAWAFAPTAAFADGLSTTFMLLSQEEITVICEEFPQFGALLLVKSSEPLTHRLVSIGSAQVTHALK